MALADFPKSYKDEQYAALDSATEQKLGLPPGMVSAIRTEGERSNADQVSSASAKTPYQFTPETRALIGKKYGIDVYLNPANASEGAGLLLQEGLKRNQNDPEKAVREYHGGTNPDNWGKQNDAYWARVAPSLEASKVKTLAQNFQQWNKNNPATPAPAAAPAGADPVGDKLIQGFAAWKQGADLIPDTTVPAERGPVSTAMPVAPAAPAPSIMDTAIGSGEAILNAATGMTGGMAGMAYGTGKGIVQSVQDGTFGTDAGVRAAEKAAADSANALTYQPRTESGQDQAHVVGEGMQAMLPIAAIAHTLPPLMSGAAKGTPAGVIARAGAEGGIRDVVNVLTGDKQISAPATKVVKDSGAFASSADHVVGTEDRGPVNVTVHRTKDGGALLVDENGHIIEHNPAFATGKTDAEILKYDYEPQGHTGSTPKAPEAPATPTTAGDVAAGMASKGIDAVASGASKVAGMAKGITTLPRRALERLTAEENKPTAGTRSSGGSAGTDMAGQRKATADQLPVPMGDLLTKGDLTRDPAQQKFEVETAKLPDEGKPLRDRIVAKNQAILDNFDAAIDQTGAEAPTLRAVGQAVDTALVDKAKRAKTEIRARYKAAENAGEMEAPVTLQSVVDHLNESAPDAATAPLLTTARARAIQAGMAIEGPDGMLVAQPVSLKRAETFRQAIGAATDYTPTNVRQSTIIKGLVDEATQGMGGDLYKQARAARARYAQEFENHAVIAKLLNNKRGSADRQVAMEDIFHHAILKGSLDDVRTVRKVLQTAGDEGKQAWRELQGATLRDIRDQATKSVALDSTGNRVMSPAALDKAITALDADGKLDFIFGKKGAQTLRNIREIAQISRTVSPEAAINHSNTAMTLAALADTVFSGLSGIPAPIATTTRMALKHVKDVRLRNRISDALNEMPKKAPGKRGQAPVHAPSRTVH